MDPLNRRIASIIENIFAKKILDVNTNEKDLNSSHETIWSSNRSFESDGSASPALAGSEESEGSVESEESEEQEIINDNIEEDSKPHAAE